MADVPAGPTGGRWTIWNRLVCFFRGHAETKEAATRGGTFDVYLCSRCNAVSHLREWRTGIRYADIEQYFDERGL